LLADFALLRTGWLPSRAGSGEIESGRILVLLIFPQFLPRTGIHFAGKCSDAVDLKFESSSWHP
jgi:hypothetical protein